MAIEYVTGNIFESDADILVNTVNCVGVQGGGLARQFRERYPAQNAQYEEFCKVGLLRPGLLHIFVESDGKIIVNFPTKDEVFKDSEMEFVEDGLIALTELLDYHPTMSLAITGLGTGLGNLDIKEVLPMMVSYLEYLPNKLYFYNVTPEANEDAQKF